MNRFGGGGLKTLLSSFFDSRFFHLTFSNADVEVIPSYLMLIVLKYIPDYLDGRTLVILW